MSKQARSGDKTRTAGVTLPFLPFVYPPPLGEFRTPVTFTRLPEVRKRGAARRIQCEPGRRNFQKERLWMCGGKFEESDESPVFTLEPTATVGRNL